MSGPAPQATRFAAALVVGMVALAHGSAAAGVATAKVIGDAVRLKGTNIWFAHGKAVEPRTVLARLVPTPQQRVKVQWSIVCQKPNPEDPAYHLGVSGKSGQAFVGAAGTVKLALPYPKPPSCVATVYATLTKSGRLELQLLQT